MACIKENLTRTHLEHKAMTMTMDVMTALYKLEGEKQFDYIFLIRLTGKNWRSGYFSTWQIRALWLQKA